MNINQISNEAVQAYVNNKKRRDPVIARAWSNQRSRFEYAVVNQIPTSSGWARPSLEERRRWEKAWRFCIQLTRAEHGSY